MVLKKKSKKTFKRKLKRRKHKKRKKRSKTNKNALPEVDKQLYEIQISDLNDKLDAYLSHNKTYNFRAKNRDCVSEKGLNARFSLNERYSNLESEYEDARSKLEQVDDDRADVIAYLKRSLQNKIDQVNELQERMRASQMSRDRERNDFDGKYADLKLDYELKLKNLTSELHVSNEKLKTLEEFRLQREDLLMKFEKQQRVIDHQEDLHNQAIRSIEKEYALKKIQMKKEVDEKLLQLSSDLQLTIRMKLDATTKITMNENYLLNKEIDKIMSTCKTLINENDQLKTQISKFKNKLIILKDGIRFSLQMNSTLKKKLKTLVNENMDLRCAIRENIQMRNEIRDLLRNRYTYEEQLNKKCDENERLFNEMQLNRKKMEIQTSEIYNLQIRLLKLEDVMKMARNIIRESLQEIPCNNMQKYSTGIDNSFVVTLLNILETDPSVDDIGDNKKKVFVTNGDENERNALLQIMEYSTGKLGIIPQNKSRH